MLMPYLRLAATAASNHIDNFVARRLPDLCPFFTFADFPRSGVNWIRDMAGDCLQLPVMRMACFPTTTPGIVQTHSAKPILGAPAVYVLRDGRDVFVSHFWLSARGARHPDAAVRRRVLKLHPSLREFEKRDPATAMLRFYEEWRVRSAGSRVNWGEHVRAWLTAEAAGIVVVRYEDFSADTKWSLARMIERLTGETPPDYVLDFAVKRNDFLNKTGRQPGVPDNLSTRRSGVPGSWRHEMPDEIADRFLTEFGAELELAGYGRGAP